MKITQLPRGKENQLAELAKHKNYILYFKRANQKELIHLDELVERIEVVNLSIPTGSVDGSGLGMNSKTEYDVYYSNGTTGTLRNITFKQIVIK